MACIGVKLNALNFRWIDSARCTANAVPIHLAELTGITTIRAPVVMAEIEDNVSYLLIRKGRARVAENRAPVSGSVTESYP
jgi:hypothetical protein